MPRDLDFIVPHYDETPDIMEPLLDSIRLQRQVDQSRIGVIISYDGPDAVELPLDEWRERYPFAIEDVHPERGGVSHTRNAGLDASDAAYVIFADADDCLLDARGLHVVLREASAIHEDGPGFDFLLCDFIEETRMPDGTMTYVTHHGNTTFVHSQVARRQWLVDNEIRFCDSIRVHEDAYYIQLCLATVNPSRCRLCSFQWYLWCWRDESVCRHDPLYIQKTYTSMIDATSALIDQLIRRSMSEKAVDSVVSVVFDAYYTMNKGDWLNINNKEYRDGVERRFAEFFAKYHKMWDDADQQRKVAISQVVRQRSVLGGMLMEAMTVDQWLDYVQDKYTE